MQGLAKGSGLPITPKRANTMQAGVAKCLDVFGKRIPIKYVLDAVRRGLPSSVATDSHMNDNADS
jgi:hypothetical protein